MADMSWLANTRAKTAKPTLDGTEELRIIHDPGGAPVSRVTTTSAVKDYVLGVLGTSGLAFAAAGALLTITALAATDVPLTVKAHASQSGNLTEWQNSAGTPLGSVSAGGRLSLAPAANTVAMSVSGFSLTGTSEL
jgi:hypothetical protein